MSVKRVTPEEAAKLQDEGWELVDVRSIPEFEEGHPQGAYNVPLAHRQGGQMVANPEFIAVMKRRFAADRKLIMSCKSGGRSNRAAQALLQQGYAEVVDMRGGFHGEVAGGKVEFEGWQARGLPVASAPETGRSYDELKAEDG